MKKIFNFFSIGSRTINILVTVGLFFFTFGQLGRISIPGQPIYFYLYEIFVYPTLFLLIYKLRLEPFQRKKATSKPILYFFIWLSISLLISFFYYTMSQNIVAFLYLLRLAVYFLLFMYFNSYVYEYLELQRGYQVVIGVIAIGVIASSLVQYFLYQNFGNISYLGWDPHQFRLVGLFFDPPLTVSVLALFLFYYFLPVNGKYRFAYCAMALTFFILMFLTYSRGGYLALIVAGLWYAFRKMDVADLKQVGIGLLIIVAIFLLIPKGNNESINLLRTTSIFTRARDYAIGLDIWQKSPLLGIGYNHIRYEKDIYAEEPITEEFNPSHASASFHSSFLIILSTAGVVGLALFVWVLYRVAMVNEFGRYSMIFLSVLSLTDNVLLHPFILFLLFILTPMFMINPHPKVN